MVNFYFQLWQFYTIDGAAVLNLNICHCKVTVANYEHLWQSVTCVTTRVTSVTTYVTSQVYKMSIKRHLTVKLKLIFSYSSTSDDSQTTAFDTETSIGIKDSKTTNARSHVAFGSGPRSYIAQTTKVWYSRQDQQNLLLLYHYFRLTPKFYR